ncbi:MAG: transcription-repair coupling factor [Planctomycetota bacterium]|jgi:transcription-repair coupling factor (superfamily II helicase)
MLTIGSIAADPQIERLTNWMSHGTGVAHVTGLWGSSAPMALAMALSGANRRCLFITGHSADADQARDDFELFHDGQVDLFPAWETIKGEGGGAGEVEAERLRICRELLRQKQSGIVIAPIQALMQSVPPRLTLDQNTIALKTGPCESIISGPESLLNWSTDRGFTRLDLVESPGDVAMRGDIVDLFVPGEAAPVRVQFFDNEIEAIRRFDPGTQRSSATLTDFTFAALPVTEKLDVGEHDDSEETDLFSYLPENAIVVLDGPGEIQEMGLTLRKRLGDRLHDVESVFHRTNLFPRIYLARFGGAAVQGDDEFSFQVQSLARFETVPAEAVKELCRLAHEREVHVVCDNAGERMRLREMVDEQDHAVRDVIKLHEGIMHRGFEWTGTRTVVAAHHEIFHRHRKKRRLRKVHAGRALESWTDLQPDEIVVHVVHGIARYRGLSNMRKGESSQQEEFLTLEFADAAVIHVPCTQIDLVQKYIGTGRKPELSKLGGKKWSRTKEKVAESVAELAESLLRVQAVRNETRGTAYPSDTEWQREFEAAFLYEETEDQLDVAREIKEDLSRARPMDRLVCGDVGYGKTELAMRAAFKVIEYGRQVAVLVPTTVLAEQHYQTFKERMAEFPFAVACLSRFRTSAAQKKVIEQAKRGQVDLVIGTHRLLSKDVKFANLGLVVIDEEQRFGVEHKEGLKSMRETVDVLTLTATPIPRTLHMSMIGIRDISSLQTPPVDRRSILTHVRPFERRFIREAILRELNRDGQIYFIHNFVQSIAGMADTVRSIVPEARVVYGHGQMADSDLEDVMYRFARGEADILVATTIIESGIDNPNVNTIFINRAERFGLADLHQLRGRVGRSDKRAYCYPLLSPKHPPKRIAAKRLKTIEEFSELGSGFRIAMRDLEIRGAGNLLGREQSGHIAAVGYDLYCRLLEGAVRRLNKESDPLTEPVHIDLDVAAHVPRNYISSDRSRLEVYRRIVDTRTVEDLKQLVGDMEDAFGKFPKPVGRLLDLAEIRILARRFSITSISLQEPDVVFGVQNLQAAEPLFTDAPGTVRMPDPRTVHLRLPPNYLEKPTLVRVLSNLMNRASQKSEAS